MPPRSLKSIATSIAFPAWLLGHNPQMSVLAVSYSESLAEKVERDCQKVLNARWYRACFPRARISPKRSAQGDFETTLGGRRFSTPVGGSITDRGGDTILMDDPHKPQDVASDVKQENVLNWYRSTLLSRLNDTQSGPIDLKDPMNFHF